MIVALSQRSINKVGYLQRELKYALDAADEHLDGTIFLIPARLEPCSVPDRLRRWQWVDLFAKNGYDKLLLALRERERTTTSVQQTPTRYQDTTSRVPKLTGVTITARKHIAAVKVIAGVGICLTLSVAIWILVPSLKGRLNVLNYQPQHNVSGTNNLVPAPVDRKRFFTHYADHRSMPEAVLKTIGLANVDVGRSFALIAGVSTYPLMSPGLRELPAASEDISRLNTYLKTPQYFDEIVLLKDMDLTYDNLQYFLQVYFPARLRQSPKSRFIFAYSGHGASEAGDFGYLLKSTARSFQDRENGISMNIIRSLLDETVNAGHQSLVMMNSCYSGKFSLRTFGPDLSRADLLSSLRLPGAYAITAGGAKQAAWSDPSIGPGSIFYESMFKALDGKGDLNRDGVITVSELAEYMKEEVSRLTDSQQIPEVADFKKGGSLGGFFFIVGGTPRSIH